MRITLINQFYTPDLSPTAHLCASLAEHRAARGDLVTVLTSSAGYIAATQRGGNGNGVCVRRLWSSRFGSRTNAGRLLDWLSFYLPACWAAAKLPPQDVIIALTTPPFIALAGWIHKLLNPSARLILWSMDVYPEALERTGLLKSTSLVSRAMRSAHRAIFRRLDHLVCLDGAMTDLLLSQYAAPPEFAHSIIPNWEPLHLFPRLAEEMDAGEAHSSDSGSRIDASNDRTFNVLYLGNAGYGHEFQTVIDAAVLLRDEPVAFRFVGGGALRPWVKNQAETRGLGNIFFQDYVPKEQTPAVMRDADCALITLQNNMRGVMSPSKLHANLAMGLPIVYVGPRGTNIDEAIVRFACGASVRPGDAQGVADFIRLLIGDPKSRGEMRHRARRAFEKAYCDHSALGQFDVILDAVTESAQRDRESRAPDRKAP